MKTIEERAKEAYPAHEYSVLERVMKRGAYIRGAKEQKAIDDAGLYKLKERWEKEAQINRDRDIKSIKERAKLASEDYACDDSYSAGFFTGYVEGATKQKAIDEEVRLKKSDDMTKAEYDRETAFADWYLKNGKSTPKNGKSTPTFSDAIEWARKQTINEACEWLHLNLPNIEYTIKEPKPLRVSRGLLIDELKKAMDK